MDKVLNIGIAGFGMSGQIFHGPFIDNDKRFNLKKVYERTTTKSKEKYNYVEVVRSIEELFTDDIDIVVISTPNNTHYDYAKKALLAGKNVIVEKPFSITTSEGRELIDIANKNNLMLAVYQNRRFDGDFMTVKSIAESGKLGELLDYECRYERFTPNKNKKVWKEENILGTGSLYDLGVHIIDQAYSIFGKPSEIYCQLRNQKEESSVVDNFTVHMIYNNGFRATLYSSFMAKEKFPHYALYGRKGAFVKYGMDMQEERLVSGMKPSDCVLGKDIEENYGKINYTDENGNDIIEKVETIVGDYGKFYDNIYNHIIKGEELYIKPDEALDVLSIIEACIESDKKGCRIKL